MPSDLTKLRPDAAVLVAGVRDEHVPAGGVQLSKDRWEGLATAARAHRVLPAVARYLTATGTAPEEWATRLRVVRQEQALRHLATLGDMRSLGRALDAAAIPWVVAKGPVAAALFWPAPEAREYFDLDLYVRRSDFVAALRTLEDAGCAAVDRNWPELRAARRAEFALVAASGIHVDLHWHLAVLPELRESFSLPFDAMVGRRRTVDVGSGIRVPTFDPADTALMLAFHAAQAGADRLVWLGDIRAALTDPALDIGTLVERVRAARFERPFALVMGRVDRVLGLDERVRVRLEELHAGLLGVVARRLEDRYPQPWLPGDQHAASTLYAGARPTLIGSGRHMWASRRARRAATRAGTNDYGSSLWDDVDDPVAREDYFAWVGSGAN